MDQVGAEHFAGQTRFDSLVMSTDGGVGEPTVQHTILQPARLTIPALNQPQQIFDRFLERAIPTPVIRRRLKSSGSLLDLVMEDMANSAAAANLTSKN